MSENDQSQPDGSKAEPTSPVTQPEPTHDEIAALIAELGITPGQVKGRLEASRQWEKRAKDNAEKAKKWDEHETANQSELERVTSELAELRAEKADRDAKDEAKRLREEVAEAKGLADKDIPVSALRGSTKEELEEHAEVLLALKGDKPKAPPATGQGGTGGSVHDDEEKSAVEIVDAATAR